MGSGSPENDSRPLPPDSTKKYLAGCLSGVDIDGRWTPLPSPVRASCRFECRAASPPAEDRVQEVLAQFMQQIPSHRAAVEAHRRQRWLEAREPMARTLGVNAEVVFPHPPRLADDAYGAYNNANFGENGFQCSGYLDRTIRLLSRLRFYDDDPTLMVGLHYGPVLRGVEWELSARDDVELKVDRHRAAVLYHAAPDAITTGWNRDDQRVLDPWPEQRPKVYTIGHFKKMLGIAALVSPQPDPEWKNDNTNKTGFPTHGSCVYWNFDWEAAPAGYLYSRARERLDSTRPVHVTILSPVVPVFRNAQGQRMGVTPDGQWLREFPAELLSFPTETGRRQWFCALPEGSYECELHGVGDGMVHVISGRPGETSYVQAAPIRRREIARLPLDTGRLGAALRLPDGRQIPPVPVRNRFGRQAEKEALAALKQWGGVLIHYNEYAPGAPGRHVDTVDFTNHQQFQDEWLRPLADLPQLSGLGLAGTKFTDGGVRYLRELPQLVTLTLDDTKVSDRGLAELAEFKTLRLVTLQGTAVTAAGVAALQKAIPELEIVYEDATQGHVPPEGQPPKSKRQAIRDQAIELSIAADGEGDEPDGWSKCRFDPNRLIELFPTLALRQGYVLRAYRFREDGNGNCVVWGLPEDAPFPEPYDCPTLDNHLLKTPKPWDALDDVMEAIEGDGSQESYLAASLLRRKLLEFGALGHGCQWTGHTILEEDPFQGGPADENDPGLDRPTTPAAE